MMQLSLFKPLNNFDLDINIQLESFNILGVFGPSGAGKSTLLRCISGLEPAKCVYINNQPVHQLPSDKRGITLQLQACPLFPHLDVAANLAFTQKHCANQQNGLTLSYVIKELQLQDLLTRNVHSLSGGERQRVVFARTLLAGQKFIMLDEPFSALDWSLRLQTLTKLSEFAAKFQIQFIIVSHSLKELLFCCDTLIQLDNGKVINQGASADVAQAIYAHGQQAPLSLIHYDIVKYDQQYGVYQLQLQHSQQQLFVLPTMVDPAHKLVITSEQLSFSVVKPEQTKHGNVLTSKLTQAVLLNNHWQLTLNVDGQTLYCLASKRVWDNNPLSLGDTLYVTIHNLE
jgi:molybdate transport system ATP-binding protein